MPRRDRGLTDAGKMIVVIAGPNGAGKTTFAREFLPHEAGCPRFINADLIAAGLAPFAPDTAAIRAARLMLEEIARAGAEGESFAFESTLSGLGYARRIPSWQSAGYSVKLIFLNLASVDEALARVATRVRQGGHNVPADVVRRRFTAGWRNFEHVYRRRVDLWQCYDNSGPLPVLLSEGTNS